MALYACDMLSPLTSIDPMSRFDKGELYDSVKQTYDHQTDPRYGAARLWIDSIIDPCNTREVLIRSLELAALNAEIPKFNVGMLQT